MEVISKQELRMQYDKIEDKPAMGFQVLMSNVVYLSRRGVIVSDIIGSSQHSFILKCNQQTPNGVVILTIKCFMVNSYTTLSNSIELFENQCDIKSISEYISAYDTFYYNKEDEVMNYVRKGYFRNSIDTLYKINSSFNGLGILARFDVVRKWISQILEVISMIHERGLWHGGIKASNIFIEESSNSIRIVDFEFSHKYELMQLQSNSQDVYTCTYFAETANTKQNKQFNDIYALVILIYQMCFGFDCTFYSIKSLQSGIPFDETEQFDNPYDYDDNDYKYRIIKLVNKVICKAALANNPESRTKITIFYINDVITMARNIESFQNSPHHIADTFNCNFVEPLSLEPQINETKQNTQEVKAQHTSAAAAQPQIQVSSQEELLMQEMLYQQQKSQEKEANQVQKEIYSNENCSLQKKIDVYKKLDFEKYQKHSQQNSLNNSSGEKECRKNDFQLSPEKQTLQPNEIFVSKQFQNWNSSNYNGETTAIQIQSVNQMKQEEDRIEQLFQSQKLLISSELSQEKQLSQGDQNQQQSQQNNLINLQIQPSKEINITSLSSTNLYYSQQSPLLLQEKLQMDKGQPHQEYNHQTMPSIYIQGTQESMTAITSSQCINENQQQPLLGIHDNTVNANTKTEEKQIDSAEEKYEDFWVLDLSHKNDVQRGGDDHPNSYKEQVNQIQIQQQIDNPTTQDIYTTYHLNNPTSPPVTIQQALLQQLQSFDSQSQQFLKSSKEQLLITNPTNPTNPEKINMSAQTTYKPQIVLSNKNTQNTSVLKYPNGSTMYEGQIKNGIRDGYGTLYNDIGHKLYEGYFSNNEYQGQGKEFYENGQVLHEGQFENGILSGFARSYYINGNVCYEGEYLNGQCHGEGSKYDEQNVLVSTGTYANGKINGLHRKFYPNGKLQLQATFKNNKRDGKTTEYHDNGIITFQGIYKNGKKISGAEYDSYGYKLFEGEYEDNEE